MDHQLHEAVAYIKHYLSQGASEQHLRQHFSTHGWPPTWLDRAFHLAVQEKTPEYHHNQPKKYTIKRALKDSYLAARFNWKAYFLALGASFVVCMVGFGLVTFAYTIVPTYDVEKPTNTPSFPRLIAAVLFVIFSLCAWYTVSTTFIVTVFTRVLNDGLHRKRSNSIQLLKKSVRSLPKVIQANIVGSIITFGPFVFVYVLIFFIAFVMLGQNFGNSNTTNTFDFEQVSLIIMYTLPILAFVWIIIASLRLALVQQVAVMEPRLSILAILRRSSFLLQKGGQWFLLKGFVVLIISYIIMLLITGNTFQDVNLGEANAFASIISLLAALITMNSLCMLYLNRATIRK